MSETAIGLRVFQWGVVVDFGADLVVRQSPGRLTHAGQRSPAQTTRWETFGQAQRVGQETSPQRNTIIRDDTFFSGAEFYAVGK